MVNFKEEIRAFEPSNEQEKSDQKVILAYIDTFDNILLRNNVFAHISSSGFIINHDATKTLMIFHNIYQNWGWTGGHADGNGDLRHVALQEAKEETGLKRVELLSSKIASLDILPVPAHYKNGKYISPHMHLSIAYVLVADENEATHIKKDENSGVKWIALADIEKECKEVIMHPVYRKLVAFARRNKNEN